MLSEPRYDVEVVKNVLIPMADGTRIAADLFVPRTDEGLAPEKFPAVFEAYPYRKDDLSVVLTRVQRYLARRGYVGILVDVRGTGASEGTALDEYCEQEQLDLVEAIGWMAEQPWCNGNVGMFGSSYGGFNALQVAMRRPPALKAICAINFTDNRYTDDCHFLGGALQMLYDLGGYGLAMLRENAMPPYPQFSGSDWARIWDDHLQNEPWLLRWLAHQTYDEQWKNGSLGEDYGAIACATFLVGGWRDGYSNPVLRTFQNLRCPRKALIGPWTHTRADNGRPGPPIHVWHEMERFFAHWLKGESTGVMDEPPIAIYVQRYDQPAADRPMTSGEWRYELDWPLTRASERALYLAPERSLVADAPAEPTTESYEYRATVGTTAPVFSGGGNTLALDQRIEEGLSPNWTSAPLGEPIEVLGYGRVELGIAVTTDVATLVARLIDVAPDGAAALVTRGVLNLTHRASHEHPSPLVPGQVYRVTIPLGATSWIFEPGHRIRLSLAGAAFPRVWPSPRPYVATIELGGDAPARLVLPAIGSPETHLPTPRFLPPDGLEDVVTSQTIEPATWRTIHNHHDGTVEVQMAGSSRTCVSEEIAYTSGRRTAATASDRDPGRASVRAENWTTLHWPNCEIDCRAHGRIDGTESAFHVTLALEITTDGHVHFNRRWTRSFLRNLL